MVRILNEIEEDTIQVMNHSDLGNSDHNNMGLDITIIVENAVQIPNGKSKNHNNNNNSNNNSIATSPVGTADNGSYSNTNDTPDPDPDDEKNPENQLNSPSPKSMTNQTTKHKKCTEDLENPIEITTENEEIKIPTPSTHTNKNGLQKPSKGEDKPIESKKETVEAKEQKETDNCTVHGIKDNHRTPVIIVENVDEDCTSKTVVEPETSIELEEKSGTPKDNSDEPKATEQTPDDKKTGKSESGSKTDGKTPISEEPTVSKPKEAEGKTTGAGASTEPAKKDVNSSGGSVNKGRNLHHHHHHHHAHHNPHNHFKHLPNQHGHILPHLHQANAQHLLPGLLPTLGLHMPQPIDGRCLFGNLDGISQAQNLQFSVGGHPPPLHFNFFGEPKYESMNCPWNQFPPQPSVASSVPPHGGLASPQIPTAPLPTALFPLPLDPACPPAVLPSHPVVSNSSSGFSTAGHSRSSSPMAASTQAQGQTLMTAEPVTSCLPPANALLPNPTVPAGSPGHINPAVASANPNVVFSASSSEIALYPHFPVVPGQYVVFFHINPGVLVSFNVGGDHIQIIKVNLSFLKRNASITAFSAAQYSTAMKKKSKHGCSQEMLIERNDTDGSSVSDGT
ncbi:unnamed protein product [Allacma fusca]|uniref:Uncharacterized protein n=1 Tax=Allacma fusca TaxID=39272 RepID=A0A8J2K9X9_9HEXA|nr:unnamed protein product [Allacma fusca]